MIRLKNYRLGLFIFLFISISILTKSQQRIVSPPITERAFYMGFDSIPLKLNSGGQYISKIIIEHYQNEIKTKQVILWLNGLYSEVEYEKDPFIGLKMARIVSDELTTTYGVPKELIWIASGSIIHRMPYFGVDCIGKSNNYTAPSSFRTFSFSKQSLSFSADVTREMITLDSIYRSQGKSEQCRFIFRANASTEELRQDTYIGLKRCKVLIDTFVKDYKIPRFLFQIVDTPEASNDKGSIKWAMIIKRE